VLFNVDLDVEEGELVALLGTNGAGKSTLLRAIAGTQEASNGAIFLDGMDITHRPPDENAAGGIVFMPGGRAVFPSLTVEENLRAAAWMYRQDDEYVAQRTEQIYDFFPILRKRVKQQAGTMSGGEQQMLALGQAFLMKPRLLMIDELSLGLAPAIVEQLLGIVRAIADSGTTIILVEQSVNVALTVAERAVFMEKGEVRFSGSTAELLRRPDILRSVYLKGTGSSSGRIAVRAYERFDVVTEPEIALEVRDGVEAGLRPPCIATVLVGGDPASHTYVRMKVRRAERVGIEARRIDLPEVSEHHLQRADRGHRVDLALAGEVGRRTADLRVHLGDELVDGPGEVGVQLELLLLLDEVVVGLLLGELRLAVLPDHHEGRQEDRLERHDKGEGRPWALLEHEHPHAERERMDVDERHRSGELRDRVSDAQLHVGRSALPLRDDDRMTGKDADVGHVESVYSPLGCWGTQAASFRRAWTRRARAAR